MDSEILKIIGAAMLSGIISPILLSFFHHNFIWRRQKSFELKYGIFEQVVNALSALETDALNPELQNNKQQYKGMQRLVELKPETQKDLERAVSMTQSFFSDAAVEALQTALGTKVGIENIPNTEFEKNRSNAIKILAKELGL